MVLTMRLLLYLLALGTSLVGAGTDLGLDDQRNTDPGWRLAMYVMPRIRGKEGVHPESGLSYPAMRFKYPIFVPRVDYETIALNDLDRPDPYGIYQARRLMVSIFSGKEHHIQAQTECLELNTHWMPWFTLQTYKGVADGMGVPSGFMDDARMRTCDPIANNIGFRQARRSTKWPVVIISPDFAVSRTMYGLLARQLAAQGYTVLVLDSPGETNIVEFPDGDITYGQQIGKELSDEEYRSTSEIRKDDIKSVLNWLEGKVSPLQEAMDLDKVWVVGHGLGANAATMAMQEDDRILGAVNFDGKLSDEVIRKGSDKPYLIVSAATSANDSSLLGDIYDRVNAPKAHYTIKDSTHNSFWDLFSYIIFWRKAGPADTPPLKQQGHWKACQSMRNRHQDIPVEAGPFIDAALGSVDFHNLWFLRYELLDAFGKLVTKNEPPTVLYDILDRFGDELELQVRDLGYQNEPDRKQEEEDAKKKKETKVADDE